ncbi:hypothetical protein MKEN_00236000 [Mycena kentingensis (nom. inval.)]|nr:hypothetical protein MKEN_00236000 [Mycena kentingensis (nom. inval.)]
MKRSQPQDNNPGAPKRTKASVACTRCRSQKSRCELLDVSGQPGMPVVVRCHRCKVLGAECSFETSNLIHFLPKAPSSVADASPSPATSSTLSESSPTAPAPERFGGLSTLAAAAIASTTPVALPKSVTGTSAGPVPSIPSRYGILPEDLLPTATTPIWGCVTRVDWTATPMLAIQEMVRCPKNENPPELPSGGRLSDILPATEIQSLLEIFETRYSPWINLPPARTENTNSLFDIVRCTIASRHLPPATRLSVAPRLQKLTEDVFVRELFNPQPSLESIRALLILSVWTPICGTGAEARDGRLLIASAVSMGMNIFLQNESKRAMTLRADKDGDTAEIEESTHKWRLWMSLVVTECGLCLGTGRTPVSSLSPLDNDMSALSSFPEFTLTSTRDTRLGLVAKIYDVCTKATNLRLQRVDDVEKFFDQVNDITYTMEGISRLIRPLHIITPYDTFYAHMLVLQYHACMVLILHHALREVRTAYERDAPTQPWHTVETKGGHAISLFWGRDALLNAESVLTAFLSVSDLTLLSAAPDNVYVMVGFAATWIFVSNFTIYQMAGSTLGGPSERLQSLTIERLNAVSVAPDHAASRCGHVLRALMNAWERRKPHPIDKTRCECFMQMPYMRTMEAFNQQVRAAHAEAAEASAGPGSGPTPPLEHMFTMPEDSSSGNWDLFMDDTFWETFLENLNNSDAFSTAQPVVPPPVV